MSPLRSATACIVGFLLFTLASSPAEACSCFESSGPCQGLESASAVFVGEVTALTITTRSEANESLAPSRRATLQVTEVFSGIARDRVEVSTGMSDADCGVGFVEGQRYLVFAMESTPGVLTTTTCSRTRSIAGAAADLEFLRSFTSKGRTAGLLRGQIVAWENDYGLGAVRSAGFSGARIVATDGIRIHETRTDADGRFQMEAPPGRYTLEAIVPHGYYVTSRPTTIELRDPQACVDFPIVARNDGHVRGRILLADGSPVANLVLELDAPTRQARGVFGGATDRDGYFDIGQVAPGRFALTLASEPRVVLPRQSGELGIVVAAGQNVELGTLTLPRTTTLVTLVGQVVDRMGGARADAQVLVHPQGASSSRSIGPISTDLNGRFTVTVVADDFYRIQVTCLGGDRPLGGSVANVWAASTDPPLSLTIAVD
jgi:hypothetical protein